MALGCCQTPDKNYTIFLKGLPWHKHKTQVQRRRLCQKRFETCPGTNTSPKEKPWAMGMIISQKSVYTQYSRHKP